MNLFLHISVDPREQPTGGFLDSSYNRLREFGDIVVKRIYFQLSNDLKFSPSHQDGFSRFSNLLDANFDAMHGSFSAILRMLDLFGEFFYVFRSFTVIKLLFGGFSYFWKNFNRLLGRDTESRNVSSKSEKFPFRFAVFLDWPAKKIKFTFFFCWQLLTSSSSSMNGHQIIHYNDVDLFHRQEQHKKQAKSFPVLLVLIGLGFLSLPVILVKLSNALRRKAAELQLDDAWENKLNVKARALSDFNGEDPPRSTFSQGSNHKYLVQAFSGLVGRRNCRWTQRIISRQFCKRTSTTCWPGKSQFWENQGLKKKKRNRDWFVIFFSFLRNCNLVLFFDGCVVESVYKIWIFVMILPIFLPRKTFFSKWQKTPKFKLE